MYEVDVLSCGFLKFRKTESLVFLILQLVMYAPCLFFFYILPLADDQNWVEYFPFSLYRLTLSSCISIHNEMTTPKRLS